MNSILKDLSKEYSIFLSVFALILISYLEHSLVQSTIGNIFGFSILFGVIIYSSMSVAHHAEMLAEKFGEPYGTLILTMSAVVVEIIIIVIMMMHSHNPTLARDTIYSAIMLDINALLGLAAIIGGIKYGEQPYNIDSSNSYISMILVAVGLAMILPHFIPENLHNIFSIFTIVLFICLYLVFTRVQVKSHAYFFKYRDNQETKEINTHNNINGWYHGFNLVLSIALIGALAEILSIFMNNNLSNFGLPLSIGAVSVALISASPEFIVAIRAALENKMQTVINIALGASLATVLLTIPAVIIIGKIIGMDIELALSPAQGFMIALTLLVSMVNFNDGETNALEGFLHVILFVMFSFLLFV